MTLYDNEQALVTSCNGRFLQTVNLTTFKPGKNYISVQVVVQSPVQTGKYQNSFIMTNLHGDVLKKTTTKLDLFDISINRAGDCFFTGDINKVNVSPLDSERPILYSKMSCARRITTGDHNYIYVSRRDSNEIIRILKKQRHI